MENISQYLSNITIITYIMVFIAGVATSFTPCTYPLIPIIVGVIGASKEKSRFSNFILSFTYVVGVAVTFSALGIAAAITGKLFGQFQTSSTAHLVVGNIIILFGLTQLDVITLPISFLNRAGAGKVIKGSSIFTTFFMGLASGFVAAPCTVAVLAALLTLVASTQNIVLGFSLLFTFAIGLGTLILLVGTFTGILVNIKRFDKFMVVIQKVLGFSMILLGEFFVYRAGMLSI